MKHITFLLMLPACIFLVAAYVPSRIRTALKHPMLVAIKTWALAHLL
ncbi:NnrU family protein, partial [Vibrio parahaemolyticus]